MLKQLGLAFIMVLFLGACAHKPPVMSVVSPSQARVHVQSKKDPIVRISKKMQGYHIVQVEGMIDVSLHSGYSKKPEVILMGDSRDLTHVRAFVSQDTLNIIVDKGYPKCAALRAVIHGNRLSAFYYKGSGMIRAPKLNTNNMIISIDNKGETYLNGSLGLSRLYVSGTGPVKIAGISSRALEVHLKNSPRVMLSGKANLSRLDVKGQGDLSFYWVDSDKLCVKVHNRASVRLAGVVNQLHVDLWNHAQFQGRYLRAGSSFVKTHDNAVAEITSLNKQHSLAKDISNIYYYEIPNMQTNLMAKAGSVLDMRNLGLPNVEEYDEYNKSIP